MMLREKYQDKGMVIGLELTPSSMADYRHILLVIAKLLKCQTGSPNEILIFLAFYRNFSIFTWVINIEHCLSKIKLR